MGYRIYGDDIEPLNTVAQAEALSYSGDTIVSVLETGRVYQFDPASTATRDGIRVLTPAGGGRLLATAGTVTTDEMHLMGDGSPGNPIEHSQDTTDLFKFFVGAIISGKAAQCLITSNGSTVTASVQSEGGGDIRYVTLDGYASLDCTPPATVQLTAGSDSNPVENFIYIDILDGNLKKSTTGFPATSHVPIDRRLIPSASFVQASGTYPGNNFSDHVFSSGDNGHLTHINQNFRKRPPIYLSGASVTISGSGTGTCTVAVASGLILMNHERVTKSFSDGSSFLIANDQTTPYQSISNIYSLSTDTTGATLTGRWAAHFLWYGHAQEESGMKLLLNKPSGSYLSADEARSDSSGYFNSSVPPAFRGCAIGLRRIVARKSATGTIEINYKSSDDWRGKLLASVPGSGGTTSFSSVFPTSDFRLHDPADASKEIAFDASAISTGQTRTISMPDRNVDLAPASREATTSQSGLMSAAHVTDLGTAKKSILDADGDTGIEAERSADIDTLILKTSGVDRVKVESNGVLRHYSEIANTSSSSAYEWYGPGGILRSKFLGIGSQVWYLNDGTNETGSIAYSTPTGAPGIVFFDASGLSRSQFRQLAGGGLALGGNASAASPIEMLFIRDGYVSVGANLTTARLATKGSTSDDTAFTVKLTNSSNSEKLSVRNDGQLKTSGSRIIDFQTLTTDTTLTQSSRSCIICNPSGAGMVLTLHLSPPDGIRQVIVNASVYSVTIGRNGQKIAGLESNYTLTQNSSIVLQFIGATLGWLIISNG